MPSKKQKKYSKRKIKILPKRPFCFTVIKIQAVITAFVLVCYLLLGCIVDPSFFKRDFKDKAVWAAGASNLVSLSIVNSPPDKPVITVDAACDGQESYVGLSWGVDPKVEFYDVYRNGEMLFMGETETTYVDYNVMAGINYLYYIIANGMVGFSQSDTVNAVALSCYVAPPENEPGVPPESDPTVQFSTLDKVDLRRFKCLPKTDRMRPIFTGSSNIPSAKINLNLVRVKKDGRSTVLVANIDANSNGFWYFRAPEYIKRGRYIMYATATDPNDPSRSVQTSLRFNAVKRSTKKKILTQCWSALKKKKSKKPSGGASTSGISINADNNNLRSGDNYDFSIPKDGVFSGDEEIQIRIINSDNEVVYENKINAVSETSDYLNYQIVLPGALPSDRYTIQVKTDHEGILAVSEATFRLQEAPVLNFGGNIILTMGDILGSLSAILIILLGILLLFLVLLFLEYLLSKQRTFDVDESSLRRRGLIS